MSLARRRRTELEIDRLARDLCDMQGILTDLRRRHKATRQHTKAMNMLLVQVQVCYPDEITRVRERVDQILERRRRERQTQ